MEITATVRVIFSDEETAIIVYKALKPETVKPPTERSNVSISLNKETLIIKICSKDFSSLRASFNSYSRWLNAIIDSLKVVKKFEHK
ncbi:MAG: KEOPS complex subunit Pcc1 [Candidatus Njordarchaeia archaeon]